MFSNRIGLKGVVAACAAAGSLAACATTMSPTMTQGVQNYADRQGIETTLVRYTTGLDTLDPDLYASSFSEEAEFTVGDTVYHGRGEIRSIITGMQDSRAERAANAGPEAADAPPTIMHHVMTNAVIDIVDADTAYHHAYWMTVIGSGRDFSVAGEGRYEDELVKRDGEWLIYRRKLLQ